MTYSGAAIARLNFSLSLSEAFTSIYPLSHSQASLSLSISALSLLINGILEIVCGGLSTQGLKSSHCSFRVFCYCLCSCKLSDQITLSLSLSCNVFVFIPSLLSNQVALLQQRVWGNRTKQAAELMITSSPAAFSQNAFPFSTDDSFWAPPPPHQPSVSNHALSLNFSPQQC